MKIIFVDIDGVLNSCGSIVSLGVSQPDDNLELSRLCPVSVGLLRWIHEKDPSVHLYIHSTWAKMQPREYFVRLFEYYGFKDPRVLDIIPNYEPRSQRIKQALSVHNPENYVVIDDIDLSKDFGHNMVHVDGFTGLSYVHFSTICNQFGIHVPVVLL